MKKALLEANSLYFSFPDRPDVIDGISFSVAEKEKIAVIGANGSGKTTLFLLLCGILKPMSGTILLDGKPVRHNAFNSNINYLFQSPVDQLFSPRLYDDVAFGPLNMGLSREETQKVVDKALDAVGLSIYADAPSHHLSGGEKRLAAVATLLSMNPRVLLFDEPTSNLDARNRRKVIDLIRGMDTTMLVSSHDLEFLLEVCSRCLIMDSGRVVADGGIRPLLSDGKLLAEYHMEKPHSLIPHDHSILPE